MEDKIVNEVVTLFKQRSEVGIRKYGTTMDREDLTPQEWLKHLREELMDAVIYTTKLLKVTEQIFNNMAEELHTEERYLKNLREKSKWLKETDAESLLNEIRGKENN